jgi:hypothetical protein
VTCLEMAKCSHEEKRCCLRCAHRDTRVGGDGPAALSVKGGAFAFVQGRNGEWPKGGERAGSEVAPIFHREGDQNMRATMNCKDGISRGSICI